MRASFTEHANRHMLGPLPSALLKMTYIFISYWDQASLLVQVSSIFLFLEHAMILFSLPIGLAGAA